MNEDLYVDTTCMNDHVYGVGKNLFKILEYSVWIT